MINMKYIYILFLVILIIIPYYKKIFNNINKFINKNGNITAIVLNYNRPHNIKKLITKLKELKYIDEIIISHGKKDTQIIIDDNIIINETKLRNKYYSATRFELSKMAKNNIILFLDDDLYPTNQLINNIINQMEKDGLEWKQNIYGPFKRVCNNKYSFTTFNYNIVLTKLAIVNKKLAIKVWDKIKNGPDFKILMDNKGNGEDILFAKYIEMFNGNNVYVNGKYIDLDGSNGYSSQDEHYNVRTKLCETINNNDYGQIIEKNIMMCSYHNKIEDMDIKIQKNINKLKNMNPEYKFYYYNDKDIIDFIKKNYNNEILYLFTNINDCYGAAKADFFRYLWIYRMGGVYLDLKSSIRIPLKKIIKPFDEIILSSWKSKNFHDNFPTEYGGGYIDNNIFGEYAQWNIICKKNNPLIKKVIDSIKNKLINPNYKYGGRMVINTTGPVIYTNAINKIINKYNYTFKYNSFNNNLLYTIYKSDNIHRNKIITKNNYRTCSLPIMKFTESKSINELIDKIYVINLKKNTDRWDSMSKMAENANINITRFDAINGKELASNHPDILKYFVKDHKLNNGQIGCALSHIKIWEDAIKNNYENIIIFEDDAIIPDNFWNKLQSSYNEMPDNWDILYLDIVYGYLQKIDHKLSRVLFKKDKNSGLHGYILNNNFIKKILNGLKSKLNVPIDVYIVNNNNNYYMTYPNIINFSNNYISDTQISHKKYSISKYKKLKKKIYLI
jgi:GR25 family glycosyltransferase involved in LPS biosynthesis